MSAGAVSELESRSPLKNNRGRMFYLFVALAMGCADPNKGLLYRGEINDEETIELRQVISRSLLKGGGEANFAALHLSVGGNQMRSGVEVDRREFAKAGDVREWQFGALEGRTEPDGQKVWIVDLGMKKIVTSLDRYKGSATGPEDTAPPWALIDGGAALKRTHPK